MKRRGQGLIEYLILVCLISVAAIGVVSIVGKNVKEVYANVSAALRSGEEVKVTPAGKETYELRGMDDFMKSARKPKGE